MCIRKKLWLELGSIVNSIMARRDKETEILQKFKQHLKLNLIQSVQRYTFHKLTIICSPSTFITFVQLSMPVVAV